MVREKDFIRTKRKVEISHMTVSQMAFCHINVQQNYVSHFCSCSPIDDQSFGNASSSNTARQLLLMPTTCQEFDMTSFIWNRTFVVVKRGQVTVSQLSVALKDGATTLRITAVSKTTLSIKINKIFDSA
jgi:hypothetical protein